VQPPQGAQLTGTNRPRTWHTPTTTTPPAPRAGARVRCAVPGTRPAPPRRGGPRHNPAPFPAATAKGKPPVPSRTPQLSPPPPMERRGRPRGRVGHRRNTIQGSRPDIGPASLIRASF